MSKHPSRKQGGAKHPTPMAEAARACQAVATHPTTFDAWWSQQPTSSPEHHATVRRLVHQTVRWWRLWEPALNGWLERPMPKGCGVVRWLMGVAMAACLEDPERVHFVTDHAVHATDALGQPRLKPLVNAWLRQNIAQLQARAQHATLQDLWPRWLFEPFDQQFPDHTGPALQAFLEAPWITLRHRPNAGMDLDSAHRALLTSCPDARPCPWLPQAFHLPPRTQLRQVPGWSENVWTVQGLGAQQVAKVLNLPQQARVLDACAAPGGKTQGLLDHHPTIQLTALEQRQGRWSTMVERLTASHPGHTARLLHADATQPSTWWDGQPYDAVVIDAPCSCSGTLSQHMDLLLRHRPNDLQALVAQQRALIQALVPCLRPGGRLVFATCSVLAAENDEVVAWALEQHPQLRLDPPPWNLNVHEHPSVVTTPYGLQYLPTPQQHGFYLAVLLA